MSSRTSGQRPDPELRGHPDTTVDFLWGSTPSSIRPGQVDGPAETESSGPSTIGPMRTIVSRRIDGTGSTDGRSMTVESDAGTLRRIKTKGRNRYGLLERTQAGP